MSLGEQTETGKREGKLRTKRKNIIFDDKVGLLGMGSSGKQKNDFV